MEISKNKLKEILEYLDMFGTKPGFYAERKSKFYTVSGGLLTIMSLCLSIIVFIIFSLDDFRHITPQTTSSLVSPKYTKIIKFRKEKIWIPMRIVDQYSQFVNPEGLVYPIFQYGYEERKNKSAMKSISTNINYINYRLCNETSMANRPGIYSINTPLNELYCIDMDDLEIGGSHNSFFFGYVKGDFYYCQNGDNFNETNPNCTSYKKIKEKIGENSSLVLEIYYPQVQFQPTDYESPVNVIYKTYSYRFSRYSNKIERLILQEYKLKDDKGFFNKIITNSSYWGVSTLDGHYYSTKSEYTVNQVMTSRLYSFIIYLEPSIIFYERKYKKFLLVFAEGLPLMYVVFIVFENIAKIFKLTEENKTMIELLFENLKEKPNKFEKFLNKIKNQKSNEIHPTLYNFQEESIKKNRNHAKNVVRRSLNVNQKHLGLQKLTVGHEKNENVINLNSIQSNIFNHNLNDSNAIKSKQGEEISSNFLVLKQSNNLNLQNRHSFISNSHFYNYGRVNYVNGKLFPYKFYLFSTCIKSVTIKKNNCLFSEKFSKVYTFLTRVLDISTYLILQREFNILKTSFLDDKKKLAFIEQNNKINVNDHLFLRNINQSLESQNFHIFTQNKIKK